MRDNSILLYPRSFMARIIYAWLFGILVYFFINNSLLSQMQAPPLIDVGSDNTYWLFHILNIPQTFLQKHVFAVAFDVVVTTSCLIFIFVPDKTLFAWITVIGIWILYMAYCSAAGHHYAQIGYLLPPIAFLTVKEMKFSLLWNCIRYWVCFLYFSAGLYKLYYGGFQQVFTMTEILKDTNAGWFYFNSSDIRHGTIQWLILHPSVSQWLYRSATFVDLAMVIGFFTKKRDTLLFLLLLSFHVGNYLLLHISFVEQSLIFAPFLPWQVMAKRIINSNYS